MSDDNEDQNGGLEIHHETVMDNVRNKADFEKDIIGANDDALRLRIALLEEEHRDLDKAIKALQIQPSPELLVIARLKKKKLNLKDEISRLYDQVEPDIIA